MRERTSGGQGERPGGKRVAPLASGERPVSRIVLVRVRRGGERLWRLADFADHSPAAVAQAFSRLAAAGELRRVGRGLYHRGRATVLGTSVPDPGLLLQEAAAGYPVFPAGLSAASVLGFSTQSPAVPEVSTVRASLKRGLLVGRIVVRTRRPVAWMDLGEGDGALLEFLRSRGAGSELDAHATIARVLLLLRERGRFQRLLSVAATEPPRVRALLGALGEELGVARRRLEALRQTLNPLSRFDFGPFRTLPTAPTWFAKAA